MKWEDFCQLLLDPPSTTLHARVRWDSGDSHPLYFLGGRYSWGPGMNPPAEGGEGPGTVEFWRDGERLRVELNGNPHFISDGEYTWTFTAGETDPVHDTVRHFGWQPRTSYGSYAAWLMSPPPVATWIDNGVPPETPIEDSIYEGRPAWFVTVNDTTMWVDQKTRQVLALGVAGSTRRESLVAPEFGEQWEDALFTWAGPVVDAAEMQRRRQAEKEERAQTWMRVNVTDDFSPLPVTLELNIRGVPLRDSATGNFSAYGDGFTLWRNKRNKSDDEAEELANTPSGTSDPMVQSVFWSTPFYDWGLTLEDGVTVDRVGMEVLWNKLHPGVSVERVRF